MGSGQRLDTLDGMRGAAALLVAIYHLSPHCGLGTPFAGYLAVDFFFVLSGLVISRAYTPRLAAGLPIRRFLAARLLRLLPVVAVGTLLGFVFALGRFVQGDDDAMSGPLLAASLLLNALALPAPIADGAWFPLAPPVWSLFVEILANTAFVLGLWRFSPRALGLVAVVGAICVVASALRWGGLDVGWSWPTFLGGLSRAGAGFAIGMMLARRLGPRPARQSDAGVLGLMAALLLGVAASRFGGPAAVYDPVFALTVCPLLVYAGALTAPGPHLQAICRWLGRISFPLYAIHYPAIEIAHYGAKVIGAPAWLWAPLLLVGLVISAAWLEARFEPFAKRTLGRMFDSPKPAPEPAST